MSPVVTSCSALIIPIPSLLLSPSALFVSLAPSHLVVPPSHFLSQPSTGSPLPLLSVPNCSKAHLNSLGSAASPGFASRCCLSSSAPASSFHTRVNISPFPFPFHKPHPRGVPFLSGPKLSILPLLKCRVLLFAYNRSHIFPLFLPGLLFLAPPALCCACH